MGTLNEATADYKQKPFPGKGRRIVRTATGDDGVRPSSGAATSANTKVWELSSVQGGSGTAAPEDGRTPMGTARL